MMFSSFIGIDYSGAETAASRIKGLQVFVAEGDAEPRVVRTPAGPGWKWSRKELTYWLLDRLASTERIIVGIDHGFSFPVSYFRCYGLSTWDEFLEDFCKHWPTDDDYTYVDFIREKNPPRTGRKNELRLTEKWTSSATSVFRFDGQGAVGKSTHAGLPWLRFLRRHSRLQRRVHFWPFDGFDVPAGKSVVAEVYSAIFRRRYPQGSRTGDEHDAFATASWLRDTDADGNLPRYFDVPLRAGQLKIAVLEGWILGVL